MERKCRICNNSEQNTSYLTREMMFGYRDEFEYFECSRCGCLQISEIPKRLDKYYPPEYYSFSEVIVPKSGLLERFLKPQRTHYYLSGKGIIGNILVKIFGEPELPGWVKKAKLKLDSKILDVGCGLGQLVVYLKSDGFSNIIGIDPYIDKDRYYQNGARVLKAELRDIKEEFDFIMLNRSFEHLPEPLTAFKLLHERSRANGLLLIRIPVFPSFAWEKYRTNWVQLDAPRHLFLHSIKSIEHLAKSTGFEIEDIEFDSNDFQFWGSEQYVNDIPLNNERSYTNGIEKSIFKESDIEEFKIKAKALNEKKEGDQAYFLLRKTVP